MCETKTNAVTEPAFVPSRIWVGLAPLPLYTSACSCALCLEREDYLSLAQFYFINGSLSVQFLSKVRHRDDHNISGAKYKYSLNAMEYSDNAVPQYM